MGPVVVLTAIALAVCIFIFARRRPGYSHLGHTISELGERGCADSVVVSLGVFLPVGLVMATVWYLQRESNPMPAALAGVIAVGYVGAGLFPCDRGSPLSGSTRQALHNLAGGVQYVGSAWILWQLGTRFGYRYYALAVVVALAVGFLSVPSLVLRRGLVQRAAEVALFVGLAVALG